MLLNSRKLAFLSLLLACTVILIILSGVFEFNTLFLLAAAAFCVGIAIRESGNRFGFGFYLAAIILSLILAPNKLYCITFAVMGLYLVISEFAFDLLGKVKKIQNRRRALWVVKYTAYNLMYIPMLLLLPRAIYQGEINQGLFILFLLGGQLVLYLFDIAYNYFQNNVWGKIRSKLNLL